MSIRRLLLLAFFLLMAVIFARHFAHRAKFGHYAPRPKRTMIAQVRTDPTAARTRPRPDRRVSPSVSDRSGAQGC
ncbi:MAG: hypothetical protein KJ621_08360 [Proteobacteria bacterium]|nr:hypothetical protein [Pseudomonadota bacterium]MBU1740099.1 hypothetical protein [Pseudomonadota bacterium]